MDKKWYSSKTLWLNFIGIANILIRSKYGVALDPEYEVLILGIINVIVRAVTKQAIVW